MEMRAEVFVTFFYTLMKSKSFSFIENFISYWELCYRILRTNAKVLLGYPA